MSLPHGAPRPLAVVVGEWSRQYGSVEIALIEVNRALLVGELVVTQYTEGNAPIVHPPAYWRDAKVAWDSDGVMVMKGDTWARGQFVAHVPASALPVLGAVFVHQPVKKFAENLKNFFGGRPRGYPWDKIKAEIIRRIAGEWRNGNSTWPKNQSDLAHEIEDWCADQGFGRPPESSLRKAVSDTIKGLQALLK